METANNSLRCNRKLWVGVGLLIFFGFLQRVLQLWLLWPRLVVTISMSPDMQIMQLLPKAIMSEHPWWGLWFLQQSPPLPNFIWAAVLAFTQSPFRLAIIFLVFSALLSCIAAAAMAVLFVRMGARRWLGLALASIFLLGSDLLLLEYNPFGYLYYEMMAMMFGVLVCHAAISVIQTKNWRPAFSLGLCVALLALTRATFSYFWPVALLWLLYIGLWRSPKVLVAFLLPVILLQGGWVFKNYWVYDYWSWGTSSWGGINMQSGEFNRNGQSFNQWVSQQPALCTPAWSGYTAKNVIFPFFPAPWPSLSASIEAQDNYIAVKRGAPVVLDSVAARLYSQCLTVEFAQYWKSHPDRLIRGAWQSYEMFWHPIRQFQVMRAFPLRVEMDLYPDGTHWFRALRDSWREWDANYWIRQTPVSLAPVESSDFVPAKIIALPFFSSFISAFNFVLLHSIPFLLLLVWRFPQRIVIPEGFSFLLLTYGYAAGLSSIVEYPENMRFRLELEPIIWAMCFVAARLWLRFFRSFVATKSEISCMRGTR